MKYYVAFFLLMLFGSLIVYTAAAELFCLILTGAWDLKGFGFIAAFLLAQLLVLEWKES